MLSYLRNKICIKKGQTSVRSCEYESVQECPYNVETECKFDKKNCHLIKYNETKKKKSKPVCNIYLIAFIGVLLYIITKYLSNNKIFTFPLDDYVLPIVSGIGISVTTAAILALVIDMPSRLREYEEAFVYALASNNYLKSLDELKLTRLRNDITIQLHKASAPYMAKGLIKIDQRICELLREPYYSRYRHSVKCRIIDNSDFIEKEHIIDYKLINPYGVNKDATEFVRFTNLILKRENEDINNAFKELQIKCIVDNGEEQDLSNQITTRSEAINSQREFYDTKVIIDSNVEKRVGEKVGIKITFKDNLIIHAQYKVQIHKKDICFTKRLQHPAKNFRLDYSCSNDDVKLYGQIFGTEIKQSDMSINYSRDNSISLETFDWLLPDNGAIVVMLKNDKTAHV